MDAREIEDLMGDVASVMKSLVGNALSPVVVRLDALEKQIGAMPAPITRDDAKLAILAEIKSVSDALPEMVAAEVGKAVAAIPAPPVLPDIPALIETAVAAIPPPQDGKSIAVEDVTPLIEEAVSAAFSALPVPQNGKDVDMDAVAEMVGAKVLEAFAGVELPKDGKDGRDGFDGKDGKDADVEEIAARLIPEIERTIAAIPVPKDGRDGKDGKDGMDGTNGRDGLDAVEFLRAADGHLIVTMSNGTTRDLGHVNGKDGAPGRDGFGFDDMKAEYDGERTVTLVFTKGEQVQRFPLVLPVVIDRGVFKDGDTYTAGDGVTWGGSFWIAQEETSEKPDGGKGWRLAVKRGRDGKDGTLKPPVDPKPLKVG